MSRFSGGLGPLEFPLLAISLALIAAGFKGGFGAEAGRWLIALGLWQILRFGSIPSELLYMLPGGIERGAWLIFIFCRALVEVRLIMLVIVRYNLFCSAGVSSAVKNRAGEDDIITDAG